MKITLGHLLARATSAGENMVRSDSNEETISRLESRENTLVIGQPLFVYLNYNAIHTSPALLTNITSGEISKPEEDNSSDEGGEAETLN